MKARAPLIILPLLLACGGNPQPEALGWDVGECPPFTGERMPSVLEVALLDPLEPRSAPRPRNDSERLVFRNLYGTLVRVDCAGEAEPGLAAAWRSEDGGRRWFLTLDRGAVFWTGTPVRAADVLASWSRRADSRPVTGSSISVFEAVTGLPLDSVTAIGEGILRIGLARSSEAPSLLADPELSVVSGAVHLGWPVGAGSYRPEALPGGGERMMGRSRRTIDLPGFLKLVTDIEDGRDALDAGVDLLFTRDRRVVEYARALPEYRDHPLPWDRSYALLLPGRAGGAGQLSIGVTEALARDAVPSEARPSVVPSWMRPAADCGAAEPPRQPSAALDRAGAHHADRSFRVVYPIGDPDAAALAARLVALLARHQARDAQAPDKEAAEVAGTLLSDPAARTRVRTAALRPESYSRVLRSGTELAYVHRLPARPLDPCGAFRRLHAAAPWLEVSEGGGGAAVDLVETRPYLVLREGIGGLVLDWDGTPRIGTAPATPVNEP
jgi:hypothetical protein